MPIVVTTGPTFTLAEYEAALELLEARALAAERNHLPRIAACWRAYAANLPRPAVARESD
jgi:hypothetical protein